MISFLTNAGDMRYITVAIIQMAKQRLKGAIVSNEGRSVRLGRIEDFRGKFKHFTKVSQGRGAELWDLLNSKECVLKMMWATDDLGLPAVAGVVKVCAPFVKATPTKEKDWLKKAIGAMVCTIMQANGYQTTGRKRAVPPFPERIFRVAECYSRA